MYRPGIGRIYSAYYIFIDMKKAYCKECGKEVHPAPARRDGEPVYVGYLPCPKHSRSEITLTPKNK